MPGGWGGDTQDDPCGGLQQQVLKGLVCIYFLAAAAAAAAAARWPLFAALAAHGKARQHTTNADNSSSSGSTSDSSSSNSSSINTSSALLRFLQRLGTQTCSKRRFLDFYLTGSFVTCCCLLRLQQQQEGVDQWRSLPLVLLLLHLLRRVGEQLLLVASDQFSRMHLVAYFLGCTYHVATPLACFLSATEASRPSQQQIAISLVIWLAANYVQFASHAILANLRRRGGGPEGGPSKAHFASGGFEGSSGCMIKDNLQRRRGSSSRGIGSVGAPSRTKAVHQIANSRGDLSLSLSLPVLLQLLLRLLRGRLHGYERSANSLVVFKDVRCFLSEVGAPSLSQSCIDMRVCGSVTS
ncbi:hypothetical protein Esti_004436 [Eimeria stiedai]